MWLWDQHSSSPSSNAIWSTGGASRRTSSCRCHNCDRWLWVLTYAACILIDYRKMIGEYRTWLSFIASGHPKMHFICHVLGHVGQEPTTLGTRNWCRQYENLQRFPSSASSAATMSDENEPLAQLKPLTPTSSLSHPWHPSQAARPTKSVFLRLHVGCGMKSSLASSLRALSPPPSQPPQKDAGSKIRQIWLDVHWTILWRTIVRITRTIKAVSNCVRAMQSWTGWDYGSQEFQQKDKVLLPQALKVVGENCEPQTATTRVLNALQRQWRLSAIEALTQWQHLDAQTPRLLKGNLYR